MLETSFRTLNFKKSVINVAKYLKTASHIEMNIEHLVEEETELKTYKRRIWMLVLYCILATLGSMLFPQYTSMANLTGCYYGVSQDAVNWTIQIFMIVYVLFVLPASFLINYLDLRWSLICGSALNTIACAFLFLSVDPKGFPYVITSCFLGAVGSIFVMGMPPYLAARWFPSNELSRACAFGLFGNEIGVSVGIIFSPLMIGSNCSFKDSIENGKRNVAYILTSFQVAVLILLIFTFQNSPKVPPNLAKLEKKVENNTEFNKKIILDLMSNVHFVLIFLINGLMGGCFYGFATTANNLMLRFFPGKEIEIAWMTTVFTIMGIIGSIVAGYIMDYTHKFKETAVGFCVLSFLTYILFTALLYVKVMWVQYITAGAFGFFVAAFAPIGIEYGIEITFPASEMITSNLQFWSLQACGFIIIALLSEVLHRHGPIFSNICIGIILLSCCIIASFLTKDYKRTKKCTEDHAQQHVLNE